MHKDTIECWDLIFDELKICDHDFKNPLYIAHNKIKDIVSKLSHIKNNKKEIRILGYITKREHKPKIFRENNLFLLPASNASWVMIKGDGYFDPKYLIDKKPKIIPNNIQLDTLTGDSEARFIHEAVAKGIIQDFTKTEKLIFTLSGRKRVNPEFKYNAYGYELICKGAQIEIDSGYESENDVILIEAKSGEVGSEIIRQLFFPYKFVSNITNKNIRNIFFVLSNDKQSVSLFEYVFEDCMIYESIKLVNSEKYYL